MVPGVRRLFRKSRDQGKGRRVNPGIAEALDQLREFGYRVFDKVKRNRRNIDHVIVGPAGVFAIEAKHPASDVEDENAAPVIDDSSFVDAVWVGQISRKSSNQEPIKLSQIIRGTDEFGGWIWPLIIIPGEWRVENDPATMEARLFTRETLVSYVINQQSRLTATEIELIANHLGRPAKVTVKSRKGRSAFEA